VLTDRIEETGMRAILLTALIGVLGAGLPAVSRAAQLEQRDGIAYLSGGIGEDERAAFEEARKDFNLELVFAAKGGGNYLANIDLAVLDAARREILRTTTEGPLFLAQLPPGRYTIVATFNGETQTRSLTVPAKGRKQAALYWFDPTVGFDPAVAEETGSEPGRSTTGGSRPR
jgi:hypothetical protein